jgi:hypothetical protein
VLATGRSRAAAVNRVLPRIHTDAPLDLDTELCKLATSTSTSAPAAADQRRMDDRRTVAFRGCGPQTCDRSADGAGIASTSSRAT